MKINYLVLLFVVLYPFATIWALNTLFNTEIEYGLVNLLAIFIMTIGVYFGIRRK